MAPVTQCVFAAMRSKTEHFTAGSHKWLPYRVIPGFPKHLDKHQLIVLAELGIVSSILHHNGPIVNLWGGALEKGRREEQLSVISRFCQNSSKLAKTGRNRPVSDERLFDFRLAKTTALC